MKATLFASDTLRGMRESMRAIDESLYRTPPSPLVANIEDNFASAFHQRLVLWINKFQSELDEASEVGVRLVNFGQVVVFHLEGIGYWNPSLISLQGTTNNGEPVELIQHVNQISILLMKLPRRNPDEPRRPFGFRAEGS